MSYRKEPYHTGEHMLCKERMNEYLADFLARSRHVGKNQHSTNLKTQGLSVELIVNLGELSMRTFVIYHSFL